MEGFFFFFQSGHGWEAANMDESRKLWIPYYRCEHILCSTDISRQQSNQFSLSEICFEGKSPRSTSVHKKKKKETFSTLIKYQSPPAYHRRTFLSFSLPLFPLPFQLKWMFHQQKQTPKRMFNKANINIIISNVKFSDFKKPYHY